MATFIPLQEGEEGGRQPAGAQVGNLAGEQGVPRAVTLASWESSALTPIFTPRTLISRTQLEGGLKCTVSRRVVAICGCRTGRQAGAPLPRRGWGTGPGVGALPSRAATFCIAAQRTSLPL